MDLSLPTNGQSGPAKVTRDESPVVEAERAVLGTVLTEGDYALEQVAATLRGEDFYRLDHRTIWRAFVELAAERVPIELVSVHAKLREPHLARDYAGGAGYLAGLLEAIPARSACPHYAGIVAAWARRREALYSAQKLVQAYLEGDGEAVDSLARGIAKHGEERAIRRMVTLSEASQDAAAFELDREAGIAAGWKCGLSLFDARINSEFGGGLIPGQVGAIGGRSGAGKTTVLVCLLRRLLERNPDLRAHLFSLELENRQVGALVNRAVVGLRRGGIVSVGQITAGDHADAAQRVTETIGPRLTIQDQSGLTPEQILADARRAVRAGAKVVAVDHLHRVRYQGPAKDLRHEMGQFVERLTGLAKEEAVSIVLAVQLSRDSEKEQREPNQADIGESGQIEQHCAWIVGVWQTPQAKAQSQILHVTAKNRWGAYERGHWGVQWRYRELLEVAR